MKPADILRQRLFRQGISEASFSAPEKVVAWMGAMQAQDYHGAKWAIGLRMTDGKESKIDQAIAQKTVVRSWFFRGTLHFVGGQDFRWMRELVAPRLIAGSAKRRSDLELDDQTLAKCRKILTGKLQGGKQVMRNELLGFLEAGGIKTDFQRGYHILWKLAMDGLICFGSHQGKQPAFALQEEWLPKVRIQEREQSLAVLAERYFTSRGPATLKDFIWWSGLKAAEARSGLESAAPRLCYENMGGTRYWMSVLPPEIKSGSQKAFLLPGFDEYLLGYADRSAVLPAEHASKIVPGNNGMFLPMMVKRGKIVGTWKRELMKNKMVLTPAFFDGEGSGSGEPWKTIALAYGKFWGMPAEFKKA